MVEMGESASCCHRGTEDESESQNIYETPNEQPATGDAVVGADDHTQARHSNSKPFFGRDLGRRLRSLLCITGERSEAATSSSSGVGRKVKRRLSKI